MKTKRPQRYFDEIGFADFFDTRAKIQIMELAEPKPSDMICDLGCGNASFLIFAVNEYKLKGGIGFENVPSRISAANKNIRNHGLKGKIKVITGDMYDSASHLTNADIILDMLPEDKDRFETFFKQGIKEHTRLIRLDLPLNGFIPDKVVMPFYRHTFPLQKAGSSQEWAFHVLNRKDAKICDVWDEIYYYQSNRGYDIKKIQEYQQLLKQRLKSSK